MVSGRASKVLLTGFAGFRDVAVFRRAGLVFFFAATGLPRQVKAHVKKVDQIWSNASDAAIVTDLTRPNGIALSADEKTLYVSNADEKRKVVMQYDVAPDGSVANARVLVDLTAETAPGVPDGMKVDERGNVYVTGPGGVWVLAPDGTRLGVIQTPETASNCAWGDDGRTLYITAVTGIYRIKLSVAGSGRWK
jgi:gluconolactonase